MELMELLYCIMEELSAAGVPIVFKGAMVLNLVIHDNNPSKVERGTRDIDGDWVGDGPNMEQMKQAIRTAVKNVDKSLDIEVNREFGEKRSAGFKIINESGEKIASIDLSVRRNEFSKPYISYMNDVSITGASLDKMISDKLYAISDKGACRRMKDLLDIYVMSYLGDFSVQQITQIWEQTGREPGNFTEFRNSMSDIAEAYEKMKGIKNKPDFVDLYSRLKIFLCPFYDLEKHRDAVWNHGKWDDDVRAMKS